MNSVNLIGRLVRDPEIRTSGENSVKFAEFTIAVDRPTAKGKEKKTDFPRIKTAGYSAEFAEKYLKKGKLVSIEGRIQTGSYTNKEGQTVYTTDVFANRVQLLQWDNASKNDAAGNETEEGIPSGFQAVADEDIPF